MTPFVYARPTSITDAVDRIDRTHLAYGGGTDLLPRVKLGLASPDELIDLKGTEISTGITEHDEDRISIGGLATLAEIERNPTIADRLAALSQAAGRAATPQIRNRATLGGNLVQRPRCWYYRNQHIDCWLKGGDGCPARDGRNEHHAVFHDSDECVAVHPSDLAGCLVVLDAVVHLTSATGTRSLPVAEFYAAPTTERRTETVLEPNELITSIDVTAAPSLTSSYHKAMDRKAWAFALVGVAVAARQKPDGRVEHIRIVMSGVANTPRRATVSEQILIDGDRNGDVIERAAHAAIEGSEPLSDNRYKQQLLVALTRDALTDALRRSTRQLNTPSVSPSALSYRSGSEQRN